MLGMSRTCSVILHVYIQMYHHVNPSFFGSKDVYCMVTQYAGLRYTVHLQECMYVRSCPHLLTGYRISDRTYDICLGWGAALFHHS